MTVSSKITFQLERFDSLFGSRAPLPVSTSHFSQQSHRLFTGDVAPIASN